MQYLISTIIPFYNSEKYLNESIQSVLNQSIGFDSIELLLINDGSTDNSEKIATYFSKKYKNVKYFHQKNEGVGSASNKGLKNSTGEYLTFLGSDDILDKNAYEILYDNAKKHNAEISMGKMILFNTKKQWCLKSHSSIFSNSRLTHIKNELGLIFNASPANKLFNLDFVNNNNITYSNLRSHADAPFVIPLLFLAKKCSLSNKIVYYWRQDNKNSNSRQITQNYNRKQSMLDLNKSTDVIIDFLKKNELESYSISIILKNYQLYQKIIRNSVKNNIKSFYTVMECYRKYLIKINNKSFSDLPTLYRWEIIVVKNKCFRLAYIILLINKTFLGSYDVYNYLKKYD